MVIADLFESYIAEAGPQLVVLYPGRFQPFHLGHQDVFQALQNKFGRDNVYVATSNKTELPKSPFNFNDKLAFMTAAGIPADRIIEVASPYKLPEQFDPANTIFVVAVGSPDRDRLRPDSVKKDGSPGYFKSFTNFNDATTADQHGYVIIADERNKLINVNGQPVDVSHGTPSRAAWNVVRNDPAARSEFLRQMFGRDDPELGRLMDKIPAGVPGHTVDEGREEALKYATQAHAGQTRSGGDPYISHPVRVANSVEQYKKSHNLDALISAAYLHDTIEDTDTTHEALHDLFGGLVASLVQELTSDPVKLKQMGKADYLAHKMAAMSSYALVIKLADRLDNVKDIATAKTPEWRAKYAAETNHILDYIEKNRALSGTHQRLIGLIRAKLQELNKPQTMAEDAGGVGVIANKKQARDPRYSMSLTRDVRPGEVARQLKKMHLADSIQHMSDRIGQLRAKYRNR
jgi:hypothetical protein